MTPLLSALLGGILAVCGGVGTAYFTFRLNRDRTQTEHLRRKLEDLYLASDAFEKSVSGMMVGYLPVIEGKLSWNEMLDIQIDKGSTPIPFGGRQTMEMLINIYFPDLLDAYERTIAKLDRFNFMTGLMKEEYRDTGTLTHAMWRDRIMKAIEEYAEAAKALKKGIVDIARPLSGIDPTQWDNHE